jgi:glycosyltransferase involved in cell wall biosynthesis
VFFLVDSLQVGGTETQAVELARRMNPAEYDVTLACLRKEGPLLERLKGSSVKVIEFHPRGGMDSPSGIYQMLRMAVFLRKGKFDVIHAHDLWSDLMGVIAGKLAGAPVIISSQRDLSHDPWYRTRRSRWLRRVQRMSTVVLTNARLIREGLVNEERFRPEQVRVVYNGVDCERLGATQNERARLFPGSEACKLVVLVGNMHSEVKGQLTLIAAAPQVVANFPETRFVLVGDGRRKGEFQQAACAAGVSSQFFFLGRRDDVPEILAACDIAILPSAAEGMPNAVLEYLAAGLPTVASAVGGNLEIIEDGVTGLLTNPGDPEALAGALVRLLGDRDFATRLARNGRELVQRKFSFERLITEIDNLYHELLQAKNVAA